MRTPSTHSSSAMVRRLGRRVSAVGQVLRHRGLGHPSALDPRPPLVRYEGQQPGEPIHIDIKMPGRIDGLRHCITSAGSGRSRRAAGRGRKPRKLRRLHVATNDPSRLGSYSAAPQRAPGNSTLAWFKQHDVTVERVMTDNGPAYKSKLFAAALVHRGIAISGPYWD